MTTGSPPERISYDAEFVDDEQPQPATGEAGRTAKVATFLADRALRFGRRQVTSTRVGFRVIKKERGAYLNASNLTDEHLTNLYLNRRYANWQTGQNTEAERLRTKAKELQEQAAAILAEAQGEDATPKDHIKAGKRAAALAADAAQWEIAAQLVEKQAYTGHTTPTAADLANHRRRVANGRRWRISALALAVGWVEVQIGGLLMPTLTASGLVAAAWAKGRFTGWRSAAPEIEPLDYRPDTGRPANAPEAEKGAPNGDAGTAAQGQQAAAADGPGGTAAPQQPAAEPGSAPQATAYHVPAGELMEEVVLLNAALTAAGLLPVAKKGQQPVSVRVVHAPDYTIGNGYTMTVDLPPGAGKLVRHVLDKADVIAGELAIPVTQLAIQQVPASEGGHGRRMDVWVAEEDPYLAVGHAQSPLALASFWDFWFGVPFGQNIMAERRFLPSQFGGGFTSMFFSGMMRYGKSFAMRLAVAAALLDPGTRLYLANGKMGADWKSVARVAHRFTEGTGEDELLAFEAMLDELTEDMEQRYRDLGSIDITLAPEGRLTPELARKHGMPILLAVIDELQLYLLAMTPKRRARVLDKLKNLLRGGPAAGVFLICGTQRPDGEEVPTGFRDLFGVRVSVRCPDKRSSRMCLGDLASDAGADASVLTEDHVGIAVMATGHRWEIVSVDFLTSAEFDAVCERARAQREADGTLSGDAAGQPRVTESRPVRAVRACLTALGELETDRATLALLAAQVGGGGDLDEDHPQASAGEFAGIDAGALGLLLREAGCGTTVSLGPVEGQKNASGYKREAFDKALKAAKAARESR